MGTTQSKPFGVDLLGTSACPHHTVRNIGRGTRGISACTKNSSKPKAKLESFTLGRPEIYKFALFSVIGNPAWYFINKKG